MQNAKDSFYVALRDRLAVLNPARVVTIRAIQRPGILVEEAEAPSAMMPDGVFVLRWTQLQLLATVPGTPCSFVCEVHYAESGTAAASGLDRGRQLSAMDEELIQICQPLTTQKLNYRVTPPVPLKTNVFWTAPAFGALQATRERLARVAELRVFFFEEAEEL